MGARQLAAVADTGRLIHLAEVEALDLLAVFSELHIPDAVWREAQRPVTIRTTLRSTAKRHSLDPRELEEFTAREDLGADWRAREPLPLLEAPDSNPADR